MNPAVRLSITQLSDLSNRHAPREVVLDLEGEEWHVRETARSWAAVRGYDSLVGSIERILTPPPPQPGFAAVINKPNRLLVLVRWPWAPPVGVDELLF